MSPLALEGKVAFITGAARGQGRSHAVRFAAEGADIIVVDICRDIETVPYGLASVADLDETVRQVRARGRRIVASPIDVRDKTCLEEFVRHAVGILGRLDVVVANAGIAPLEISPTNASETWRDVLDVNLTGVFNTLQAAIPSLISSGDGGSIVITNSTAGLKGTLAMKTVGGYGYTAAKHGLVGLMRAFAYDLAEYSIRVNSVHPTGVETPMVMNDMLDQLMTNRDLSAWTNLLPIGRLQPSDVTDAVVWLVSDAARYITGVALPIDAGFTVK